MKVNEAPEKIYVQLPSRNWIGRTWNETPLKEDDHPKWKNATNIGYTRTDAFIEKACDAYCEVCGHYAHTVPYEICRHDCHYYDDFKKLLKGE